jgi:hypothetical protein
MMPATPQTSPVPFCGLYLLQDGIQNFFCFFDQNEFFSTTASITSIFATTARMIAISIEPGTTRY